MITDPTSKNQCPVLEICMTESSTCVNPPRVVGVVVNNLAGEGPTILVSLRSGTENWLTR